MLSTDVFIWLKTEILWNITLHNSFFINIFQNVIYFCDGKAEFLVAITFMYRPTILLLIVNIRAKH